MNALTWCGFLGAIAMMSPDDSTAKGRVLSKEVTVRATPEQVWTAWTTVEGLTSFFAAEADVDLRIGGKYELYFDPSAPEGQRGSEDCKVLTFIPNEMLSVSWNAPPSIPTLRDAGVKTNVVIYMDDLGDGRVRVRMRHLGMAEGDDWDKYHAYFDRAWTRVLKNLDQNIGKIAASSSAPSGGQVLIHEASVEAPLESVWNAFTNQDDIAAWMVPLVEMDLRVGGTMKTNYHADGSIGDPSTIVHRIDSIDTGHMLAMHVEKFPEGFPHADAVKQCWGVLRFDEASPERTNVRIYGLGYGDDEGSRKAMAFFDKGNAWTLEQLRKYLAKKPVDSHALAVVASIEDFAWFAGKWEGMSTYGRVEMQWSEPLDGLMMGMFRLINAEGKIVMLEFETIRETDDGIEFRMRHFSPELKALEEKDAPIIGRLVSRSANEFVFENPAGGMLKRMWIKIEGPDRASGRSEIVRNGATSFIETTVTRVKCKGS